MTLRRVRVTIVTAEKQLSIEYYERVYICIFDLPVSFSFQGTTLWKTRTILEKCLLVLTATLLILAFVLGLLLSATGRREPALQVLHVGPHTAGEEHVSVSPVYSFIHSLIHSAVCLTTGP